jgi:hypothetical protein
MPRKKKAPTTPSPADDYFAPNPETSWVSDFRKKYNGYDPIGFKRVIDSGQILIAPKGGAGLVPLVPNKQQGQLIDRIAASRRAYRPTRLIVIKPRQGVGLTTITAAIFTGDCVSNRAVTAMVSAMQPETMDSIWDTYRLMFASVQGQIKQDGGFKDGLEKKRGARDNRRQLRLASTLSAVHIANADVKQGKNLARGLSLKHWHGSEADYYRRLDNCMNSAMPAMDPSPMSIAIFETTPNMEASTYFKDFVKRNLERKQNPEASHEGLWDIWFIPWFEADYFRRPPLATTAALTPAEQELVKLGAVPENLAWRRHELNAQFGGDERAFTEAYPATLEEALSTWGMSDFFFTDAVDFYRQTLATPVARYTMDALSREPMRELTDPRDFKLCPHMELWKPPEASHRYVIAADCADSEGRLTTVGSHNYAVVLDIANGEQVAEYEANCPVYLFSQALAQMGLYYNTALIAPESNYDGRAVVDFLNVRFNYPNLYRREVTDGMVLRDTEQFGFKTTSGTRQLLVDRLRFAFNTRRLLIRSQRLLDQIVEFGHRGGAKLETSDKERGLLDDGVIALGIACAVHDHTSLWRPHTLTQLLAEKPKPSKSQNPLAFRNQLCYTITPDEFDDFDNSEAGRNFRRDLNRT